MNPECRYVEQNSGRTEYSFTVNLESCGTQFINDFEGEAGQAYLENVLVLQVIRYRRTREPTKLICFSIWFRKKKIFLT